MPDPVRAAWHEALNIERMSYLEQFQAGQLDAAAFASLDNMLSLLQASAQSSHINAQLQARPP